MDIDASGLTFISDLVRTRAAIVLEPEKEYLVRARLEPIAKEEGFLSLNDLVSKLRIAPFGVLHKRVIDAMTTNETSFFRDVAPFDALKDVILPELMKTRTASKSLNFWCGASSSGQEPYTVAILMKEQFPELASWNIKFVATDLSSKMVARSQEGKYSQLEVNRGMPASLLMKYFTKKGMSWHVNEDLRKIFEFKEMNLIGQWLTFPKLDIVFLRNVLIYFDAETKKKILGKIRQNLSPDGYLFLGGSETTLNLDEAFERVPVNGTSCYRLKK